MKRNLVILSLIFLAFIVYWVFLKQKSPLTPEKKTTAIVLKKHSEGFNKQVDAALNEYLAVKDAFVESDTASVKKHISEMIIMFDKIPVSEMQADNAAVLETAKSMLADIKTTASSLQTQQDLVSMRQDFSNITDLLYPGFLNAINYEGEKLYLQHCPMAFDDDKGANWISNSDEIVNPYLGKDHPVYKASMLHCGEVKDSVFAK